MQIIKLFFVFLLLFLNLQTARANVLLGAGVESRISKNEAGDYQLNFPVLVMSGYKDIPWIFFGEGSYFKDSASSGGLTIEDSHYELSAYAMRFISYEDGRVVNPYVIAGITGMQDKITQSFMNASDTSSSQIYAALKGGAGLWAQFLSHGFAMVDIKAMYSNNYTPQVIFGLTVRAGYEF